MKPLKQTFWDFVKKYTKPNSESNEIPQLQAVYSMYSKELQDQIKELEKQLNTLRIESTNVRRAYYKALFFMKGGR